MAVAEPMDRKALLENLDESVMIIYPAVNETHTVTIFTDVLCPYCRELHKKLADFTDHGITVRFVPFPLMAESKPILESIWCAPQDQQHFLLDAAMIYGKFKARSCDAPILSNAHIAAKAM
ncbi:thioredoxin fold domain-containing protein, partial [Proteus mirabilis]|uniref:thioredoxin fold domain-containing protein n=1 Tax=Proteus mirabilis TaxID=584 RepID=UPI0034D75424